MAVVQLLTKCESQRPDQKLRIYSYPRPVIADTFIMSNKMSKQLEDETLLRAVRDGQNRYDLWIKFIRAIRPLSILEIGVWKGDFSREILQSCSSIERYYMIDPWTHLPQWNKPFNVSWQQFEDIYNEAVNKTAFAAEKIVILRGCTKDVINRIEDNSLDLVYIDGDHTLRGITLDLISVFSKVKEDGFIGGDDFMTNPWHHGTQYEPTLVCPYAIYFSEAMRLPFFALAHNQYLIRKNSARGHSFMDLSGCYKDFSLSKQSFPTDNTSP